MITLGEYTIKLDAVNSGTQGVGLKASRLGSMMSSGLPLPSGFVIKSEAFDKFLRHNKIASKISTILEESHSAGFQRLKEMSGRIQDLIINGIMPDYIEKQIKDEYQDLSIGREAKEIGGAALDLIKAGRDNVMVSVRPSPVADTASANFSGQMKTMLCLRGQQQISYAIKETWASLFSLRAMLYRKRRRMMEMPSMGVIVQKSLEPDKSGFVYTSLPETGDTSKVVIEGSWGFSDSIISGMVAPDEYVIGKETGETERKKISRKMWMKKRNEMSGKIEREPVFRERIEAELLDPKEIKKLIELAARVEKNNGGHPQQIEWAEERGRLFIIDSEYIPDYGIVKDSGVQQGSEPIARGTCVYRGNVKGTARVFSSMSD
ncbi:MAG: PEP/pyruvate-binding domain-containing protein, partial [Candidatus Aenigmarchaeota archaeon]|nr:PEP/pyruvate-binding domain-containing protein [Candidatus Aenigmarchaeota archaeon]